MAMVAGTTTGGSEQQCRGCVDFLDKEGRRAPFRASWGHLMCVHVSTDPPQSPPRWWGLRDTSDTRRAFPRTTIKHPTKRYRKQGGACLQGALGYKKNMAVRPRTSTAVLHRTSVLSYSITRWRGPPPTYTIVSIPL